MKTRKPGNQAEAPDVITVREAGRRGGTATRDRHGIGFYRQIGTKGGESTKKLYGHLFSELGKRGGRPRRPSPAEQTGEEHSEKEGDSGRSLSSSSPD